MARNTLEAVFGALGAGLTGYGRSQARRFEEEQTRLDRERQAERDRLADELAVAGLLERGFGGEREQRAQGQQRAQTALQMALQGATAGRGGIAPSMPMPTQVQQMAAQQARPQREAVNIAGRNLSLLETAFERAQRERAEGMEEAALERQIRRTEQEAERAFRAEESEKARQSAADIVRIREGGVPRTSPIRPPTEGQERNAVYWGLMSNATRELEALRDNPEIRPFMITAYLNTPGATFGRAALNDAEQQFIRAAQDFTAGVLRKETGAAATKPEVAQTLERYIEMGGDEPGSRNAKMEARRRVTDLMYRAAIPALRYQQLMALEEATMQTAQPEAQPSGRQAPTTRPPLDSFWGTP